MRPYFLLFGDSITQFSFSSELRGWGAQLADYYTAKVDIINRGFSGYTTRVANLLLDKVLPVVVNDGNESSHSVLAPTPSLVTIFFGANDCALPASTQHVPIDEYTSNLHHIVSHAKKTCSNIILITPPPFEFSMWKRFVEANKKPSAALSRSNEAAGLYAAKVVEVAQKEGVHCIDLWTSMQAEADWRSYLNDGLHLSHEGNSYLFHKLRDLILAKIPTIAPAQLSLYNNEGILWSDIDMDNPRNSIKL